MMNVVAGDCCWWLHAIAEENIACCLLVVDELVVRMATANQPTVNPLLFD
jgi:hypothetical protein